MWKLSIGVVTAAALALLAAPSASRADAPSGPDPCRAYDAGAYQQGCPYGVRELKVPSARRPSFAERQAEAAREWRQTQARQAEEVLRTVR